MRFRIFLEQSGLVATFDFDSTCTKPVWSQEDGMWMQGSEPNQEMLQEIRRLAAQGYTIYIVTSRDECHRPEVEKFIRANKLPVAGVYCTGGDKGAVLSSLNSERHYDDMPQNIDDKNHQHPGVWIKVYHPADGSVVQFDRTERPKPNLS